MATLASRALARIGHPCRSWNSSRYKIIHYCRQYSSRHLSPIRKFVGSYGRSVLVALPGHSVSCGRYRLLAVTKVRHPVKMLTLNTSMVHRDVIMRTHGLESIWYMSCNMTMASTTNQHLFQEGTSANLRPDLRTSFCV